MNEATGLLPYRSRLLDPLLDELVAELPALLVVGARAVGKTTTLERRASTIINLGAEAQSAAFKADPDAALRGLAEPVLLDEWQQAPGVLGAVRRAVDSDPRPGRFFLTGSIRAELDTETWPGTGRLLRLSMYPMSIREQLGLVDDPSFFDKLDTGVELRVPANTPDLRGYVDLGLTSGFPVPALRLKPRTRQLALESYLEQLLTHDVEQVEESQTRKRDTQRLRRYFEAYALNSAGVLDHKTIYDVAQINRLTANAYEALLTDLFVVEQQPSWSSNRLERLVHRPKRYVIEPALVAAALRLDAHGVLFDGDILGRFVDTFVAAQLRPELAVSRTRPRLYHVRTAEGRHEIDLLAELGGQRVIGIEITANAAPTVRGDAKHLEWLRDELGDRFVAGVVLHTGPQIYELGDRIVAAPISVLWGR